MIPLRPCQTDFISGIGAKYAAGHRRVLGVASTGFGKTVCFASIAERAAGKGNRVVIVAHRIEIVDQICAALGRIGVRYGRIQPGRTMTNDLIQVAMIATLRRRLDRVPAPALLVIDEAHHGVADSYQAICNAWKDTKILGVTATPELLSGRGLSEAFDVMVEAIPMQELINLGFLAPYRYLAPPVEADLSSVRTRMGDYVIDDLAREMDKATIIGSAVREYQRHLTGRTAVAFCVSVEHAKHTAAEFLAAGIPAASVDGAMDGAERRRLIQALGTGEIKVLTNCNIATEGTDIPAVGGAILLRPTKSIGLYLQMVGRCLRPKPDGSPAIIIDHAGAVHRHGLPAMPRVWSLDGSTKKKTEYAVKTCETCFRAFHAVGDWRASAECGLADVESGCILRVEQMEETGAGRQIAQRDGELVEIGDSPAWTGGISIARASGAEFKALIAKAETKEQLREIARLRGYHWKWADRILESRDAKENA